MFVFRIEAELSSPEMPRLQPQQQPVIRKPSVKPPTRSAGAKEAAKERAKVARHKQEFNEELLSSPRDRKLEDKSPSHFAATHRNKKSRKVNRKSEIEFAIKGNKKKMEKRYSKCNPVRRLRNNFKYNEQ